MPIKMRVLYASHNKKMLNIANLIKEKYELAFNAVDVIPPAYSCDKERAVILIISGKGTISDSLRLFCRELTKARAQNVSLIIDGDKACADAAMAALSEAGTPVYDEVLYVKGGLPIIGSSVKPEEKEEILAWVDRVIKNLK